MTSMEICLQLDVGNSSAKWRLCQGSEVIARGNYQSSDSNTLDSLLSCTDRLDHIWISSVATPEAEVELTALLLDQWGVKPWFARTEHRSGSLVNSYEDPTRMGVDRWLAMLGARGREPGRLCVVDAGSALTIDFVSATGRHEGGYIIPGPALMERALLLDTGRVRFVEEVGYKLSAGTSTAEAVRHGIALAQVGAVALALDQAGDEEVKLLFCGGGGETLMQLVQRGGQWLPDLVFEGLEKLSASR
jgi:type III pantothenate kinase